MSETPKPPPPRRGARAAGTRARKRTSTPPNRVDPGWLHEALAAVSLQALRNATNGQLDVGEVADDFAKRIPGAEDGPEPAVLLSRLYAHMGHRLPLVKRIEKRLEGREKTSGIGSDVLALVAQLYLRNRDLAPHLVALLRAALDKGGKSPETAPSPEPPAAGRVPFYVPPAEGERAAS